MDKIICLGKNYRDHIAEMKEAAPEKPVLFLKPPSVFKELKNDSTIQLPWHRGVIHHECEVVFKLYKKNIIGLGLGLDLTLRETQKELKSKGHPWEISKVFKNSALCTPIYGVRDFGNWEETVFSLKINGETRQESQLTQAIMKPNEMIHYIDLYFPLCDGDLIFTGTPSGVGQLFSGDRVTVQLEDQITLTVTIK
jgi:2-keto-4-pentenoate hydratase/2-oxohepta-3-ene-1,7-dioic acid hydratase in catechol pathway